MRVVPTTHDEQMPSDGRRDGLIVEVVGQRRDQLIVMFHNKVFLKFHASQLILIEKLYPSR